MSQPQNALYAQSGGVTAVINTTAAGLIDAASRYDEIGRVYAGRNGILGVLREDLVDTSQESRQQLQALRHTPGGAFGSCRFKLPDPQQDDAHYRRLLEVFRAHDIGYFFYNGGNDSQDTTQKISSWCRAAGYALQCIGLPKTVDNDLPHTDCCPGFGSVAKYVAVSTREAGLDVASMCETSTKVFILEVMGRHAGWIAAAAGMAAQRKGQPPHIILFPERVFVRDEFLARVDASVSRHGYCVVVASEGSRDAEGRFLADAGSRDAFGHAQLGGVAPVLAGMVQQELGLKFHWAVADYLQRSARHIASQSDAEHAWALGQEGIRMALAGESDVMLTIERESSDPYRWSVGSAPLSEVANHERKLPDEFISEDGYGITQKAREYLAPLIAGEAYPPYANGIPDYANLRLNAVERKLPEYQI